MTTTAHQDTTGSRSQRTSRGHVLVISEHADGGFACDIYHDGVSADSCRARHLQDVMTVIARERWARVDLMAPVGSPGNWPSTVVSLVQAR